MRFLGAMRFLAGFLIVVFFTVQAFSWKADAHAYSAGYTTLDLTRSSTEMTYSLDELSVIELVGGDANSNGMLEQEEFDAIKEPLTALLQQNIALKIGGAVTPWTKVISCVLDRQGDATKVILKASYPPVGSGQPIAMTDQLYKQSKTSSNYVDLLTINYGKQKSTAALSGDNRLWAMQMTENEYADLPSDASGLSSENKQPANTGADGQKNTADQPVTASGAGESEGDSTSGWFSFFELGIHHILGGYDHLLFLFSLLIARQSFKQYAAMITAFTVAHSITLTLTVLGIINVSPRLVEPAIALSICYVAIDNLVRREVSYRWVLTFLFGLIHGMGFADLLKAMDLPKTELAGDLISFNLGIEAVQILLVAVLLPVLYLLHKWQYARRAVMTGSAAALALGAVWLAERVFA
ncbi:HupE/UreJ family protein [Paenibacillus protaetiae]|uniref:HupE/UreJ family protein n=1 Tax=Paenibacillus protaetiae TaxID=2509456 RepID=A0A4P6EVA4_9BACL|nr:HupE/UreJ family protein [Paenibacillus protaetiae]QAY66566.1 HupE/UreJ family protein [Paenibacillus protaetiae]